MSLTVSRILHAGYVLSADGVAIAFDPVLITPFSVNCHAFPAVRFDEDAIRRLRFAAVFISHYHEDHLCLESLDLLDRATPIYVFSVREELRDLVRALGFASVHLIVLDEPIHLGPFEIIPRPALDLDVDSLFHVRVAGLEVLHVVDSWIDPQTFAGFAARAPWDLVLWPFQTMRELEVISPTRALPAPTSIPRLPEEWRAQLRALRPRWVVPSSCQFQMEPWSWYNQAFFPISHRAFREEVEALVPGVAVVRVDPGASFTFGAQGMEPAARLAWVTPIGDQDVDYTYDPDLVPPSTAEIARRFAPLDEVEASRVRTWCREGLVARHRELGPPNDLYFDVPRVWRLSVLDHRGEATHHHFVVDGGELVPIEGEAGPLAWVTEIAARKLWGALEEGESMTSIYVRINDLRFAPEIEAELGEVDLLDDPLLRCLYAESFASYQRVQLRRILARRAR